MRELICVGGTADGAVGKVEEGATRCTVAIMPRRKWDARRGPEKCEAFIRAGVYEVDTFNCDHYGDRIRVDYLRWPSMTPAEAVLHLLDQNMKRNAD